MTTTMACWPASRSGWAQSGKHKTEFTYDQINRCTGVSFTAPGEASSAHGVSTTMDGFSRVTSRAATNGNHTLTTTFTYAAGANGGTTSAHALACKNRHIIILMQQNTIQLQRGGPLRRHLVYPAIAISTL